ncbi:DUF494 domain-containing protein [Deferribacter autotrophicus]|uniref:DUF494 domain-containing protein n=1 Tax=Deferribacter autotrophicus TaxID=500465 RepID=A0A5A8F2W4_9BACT|nr:DUF494 family protein [Deferribacter autotrophicus]KAA0258337.1 DUF494 domain-containing protein [Deferribacter autotrophicus]
MDKILIALNLIIDFVEAYDNIDEMGITDMLYNSGFEEYEIGQALTYLDFGNFTEVNGVRYFSPSEKDKFSEGAMQYIQKLQLSGAVDLMVIEEVIDRCMDSDNKVDVEMVKQTLLMTLIEKRRFYMDINKNIDELLN